MSIGSKARSHIAGRVRLFGSPRLLPADNPQASQDVLGRLIGAVGQEIWLGDRAAIASNRLRRCRITGAGLAAKAFGMG